MDIEAKVPGHSCQPLSLVGLAACDIGELWCPSSRRASGQQSHQLLLLRGRDEWCHLQYGLAEEPFSRQAVVYAAYSKPLVEYVVDILLVVEDGHLVLAAHHYRAVPLPACVHDYGHLVLADGVHAHLLLANEAVSSVGGYVAVYEVVNLAEIINNMYGAASGDKDHHPLLLGSS